MVLVIDTFKLVKGAGKSIGIYNLTKSLVSYLGAENVRRGMPHKIVVLGNPKNQKDMERDGTEFVIVPGNPLDRKTYVIWELFRVSKYARRYHADRILFPRGYRPLVYRGKDTIIVHDLIPFWYNENCPGYLGRVENAYIMNRLKASIRHADRVITISDYSRQEIDKLVPGSYGKVKEIYNGLNDIEPWDPGVPVGSAEGDAKGNPETSAPVAKEDYIVAVTTKMPHKNAKGIAAAYERYCSVCKERKAEPLPLRIIGIPQIDAFIRDGVISSENARRVTCFSYIEKYSDMCRMIAKARMFLFLSLAEGFGFPPLEAMQMGTPVVSSDRTALREVVADAGLLVDPDKPQEVAEALLRLQGDQALCKDLIAKGYRNIRRFSWKTRTQEYWDELFQ